MRVFIDTNILIDYICARDGYYEAAKRIFVLAYDKEIEVIISTLTYINAFYIGKRYGFPLEQLVSTLSKIQDFTKTSDLTVGNLSQSFASKWKDIEDAAQYYSGMAMGIDCIITRNPKDYILSKVQVFTPTEFLRDF
ncbi:MAG: PIN domain-containing protein [Mediterranea sp.]|jgi:predicted nucleic acid-binding protein|nr:PIN domain-containing protein [Mediterranea sp.]